MKSILIVAVVLTLFNVSYALPPPYDLSLYTPPAVFSACSQVCDGSFLCKTANKFSLQRCIKPDQVCDGFMDCVDGSDEENCREEPDCMPNDKILCQDRKTCAKLCNDNLECPSFDDELGCLFRCPEEQYKCKGEDKCIQINQFCDRKRDCLFGDDEEKCPIPKGTYICQGGDVNVPKDMMCDGETDCPQGDDESQCRKKFCSENGQYLCNDGQTCLSKDKVCDYNIDCPGDGDDETTCATNCDCTDLYYEYFCTDIFWICVDFTSFCTDDDLIAMLQEQYC